MKNTLLPVSKVNLPGRSRLGYTTFKEYNMLQPAVLTPVGFYYLLSQETRDELNAKLPDPVRGLLPEVLGALQAMGEEAESQGKTEAYELADFLLWAGLEADPVDEDDDEDEYDDDDDGEDE